MEAEQILTGPMTPAEYYAFQRESEEKHGYYEGEIYKRVEF